MTSACRADEARASGPYLHRAATPLSPGRHETPLGYSPPCTSSRRRHALTSRREDRDEWMEASGTGRRAAGIAGRAADNGVDGPGSVGVHQRDSLRQRGNGLGREGGDRRTRRHGPQRLEDRAVQRLDPRGSRRLHLARRDGDVPYRDGDPRSVRRLRCRGDHLSDGWAPERSERWTRPRQRFRNRGPASELRGTCSPLRTAPRRV